MTASYDPSLTKPSDQVRFKIGDTTVSPAEAAVLTDEEINAQLAANGGSVIDAAIACVRFLIAKYSRMTSISVGDTSIQADSLAKHFRDLLNDLQGEAAMSSLAVPFTGGLTYASKDEQYDDPDRVQATFTRDGVGSLADRRSLREREYLR